MNTKYVDEVRRYGGQNPRSDRNGKFTNVRHIGNISTEQVVTDGAGNIVSMPLLKKKPCFGRPERLLRGLFGKKTWVDDKGERHPGHTPCYSCEKQTPNTFLACHDVIAERIASSSSIESSCHRWFDETEDRFGPACFSGKNGKVWHDFLSAIENHGGWTSVNDVQVKLNAIAADKKEKKQRADKAKARRQIDKKRRQGLASPPSPEFIAALDKERDRRAVELKSLRHMQGNNPRDMLWITSTPDTTWDRVADVWRAREILRHRGKGWKKKDIAEMLSQMPAYIMKKSASLQARVSEDLGRIKKLENDSEGEPMWPEWSF